MSNLPLRSALLLVDVINDFAFPDGKVLLKHALPAARRMAKVKTAAKAVGMPVIYVNDNFGHWQSTFHEQIERCRASECLGQPIAKLLAPEKEDYFVLKPRHSGFYSTSLDVLLDFLKIRTIILTGFAGDICVLYTANDAYMRSYELIVINDCIASETAAGNGAAIEHMKNRLKARSISSKTFRCYVRK
ncbi:cysteine hydrolase [Luteolibacter flavescens]|uniref:Cysteine hydrolase n=1 Tax=Luteolibacter flavescens TaxID=1859460 RepID=A0ABT3FN92_9BACT|nr:isochorismatase family cysteine hydrolase [Luteolibacter flavescens]MCW1885045.1 cysteine hydrolase [Luteolibacter flavescens]